VDGRTKEKPEEAGGAAKQAAAIEGEAGYLAHGRFLLIDEGIWAQGAAFVHRSKVTCP
jgi:hypothetical protein